MKRIPLVFLGLLAQLVANGQGHDGDIPKSRAKAEAEKTYTYKYKDAGGKEVIVESKFRCVLLTKPVNGTALPYLYDIEADEVVFVPTYRPTAMQVTQARKVDSANEFHDWSELDFKLALTPESQAELKGLQENFPKVRQLNVANGELRLKTPDPSAQVGPLELNLPMITYRVPMSGPDQAFHFRLNEHDAQTFVAMHRGKAVMPITLTLQNPCEDAGGKTSYRVGYNPDPIKELWHFEQENLYAYPQSVVTQAEVLEKELAKTKDGKSRDAIARKILGLYAENATDRDRAMLQAFGYPNFEAAIDDIVRRQRDNQDHWDFDLAFFARGYRSCLAGLLYHYRIDRAKRPHEYILTDTLIDIANRPRWDALMEAEDYDPAKALARLKQEPGAVYVYTKPELEKLKAIDVAPDIRVLRRLITREWIENDPQSDRTKTEFFSQ